MLKAQIKKLAPSLFARLKAMKARAIVVRRSFSVVSEWMLISRYMRWDKYRDDYWRLSSELIFQYHKLEKGLCIGGPQRFFGLEAANATLRLINEWKVAGLPTNDPVFLGCMETLSAYQNRIRVTQPPPAIAERLFAELAQALEQHQKVEALSTPLPAARVGGMSIDSFRQLAHDRRSVRWFQERAVDRSLLEEAIAIAQLAPSACNRQPWRVHVYDDRAAIDAMLRLQNGNAGFGHRVPMLLAICADARSFFDGSEKHEPYLDAGLFLMALLFALQSNGLSSCCLNWCVDAAVDERGHIVGGIPRNEIISTLVAVGYAHDTALVPRSPRRSAQSLVVYHSASQP